MSFKIFPVCNVTECFGCDEGRCTVLIDNKFEGKKCPFFKTREQVAEEKAYCEKRLADIKRGNMEE